MHQPQYEFNAHFLVSPLVGAAMSVLFSSLMGHFGVFPAPLGAYTIVLPGVVTTSICEFFLLQSKYRETLPQLKIFACILLTEAAFINFNTVYVLYRVLSMQMDPSSQAIFACLLPVIKFTLIVREILQLFFLLSPWLSFRSFASLLPLFSLLFYSKSCVRLSSTSTAPCCPPQRTLSSFTTRSFTLSCSRTRRAP